MRPKDAHQTGTPRSLDNIARLLEKQTNLMERAFVLDPSKTDPEEEYKTAPMESLEILKKLLERQVLAGDDHNFNGQDYYY